MRPYSMAAALLTSCLAVSACEPKRIVTALPIPAERTDCQAATGKRPQLNPEYVIDWSKVQTATHAKIEHDRFVSVIRGRENTVANYVLEVEGMLHQCSLDAAWIREVQAQTTR
jgi:hypothetical protein